MAHRPAPLSAGLGVGLVALPLVAWLIAPAGCLTARGKFGEPRARAGLDGGEGGSGGQGGRGGNAPEAGGVMGAGASSAPLRGASGVWENVTPGRLNLTIDYPEKGQNFGAQDVLADPVRPGTFYGFVCFQGAWKSTDWGATWTKVSRDGNLEKGKPWGEAIAPDGSYMLAAAGNANGGAWRSTDGGQTWSGHLMGGGEDPYMFDIDPADKNHVIATTHSTDIVYESRDGGLTWSNRGPAAAGGISGYIFFINSTTWLLMNQNGSNGTQGTRRTTNSGASWSKVGPMEHLHGGVQIYVDPDNGAIYLPAESGVHRSTDGGASFTRVSEGLASSIFATGDRIYATRAGATQAGDPPTLQSALRSNGAAWAPIATPPRMTNGAKRAATMLDRVTGKWVIVGGHWLAGFWRYIEE